MVSFLENQSKARIGNDAGWVLEFYTESMPSGSLEQHPKLRFLRVEDYYADIQAELVGCENNNLRSGVYTFVIEGLIDEHYRVLSLNNPTRPTVVKLYLYWRDTIGVGGYLSSFAGITDLTGKLSDADLESALVAVLAIKRVSRKAGSRRYETTIQAEERVFNALNHYVPSGAGGCEDSPKSVLQEIQLRTGIQIHDYGFTTQGFLPSDGETNLAAELACLEECKTYAQEINELAQAMEAATHQYGRGMLLIRDGELHFGIRNIPLVPGSDPQPLKLENGLIEIELSGTTDSDPYFDRSSGQEPPRLTNFKLTLKGRPDLKPGDLVQFNLPPEDEAQTTPSIGSAILGVAGPLVPVLDEGFANAVTLYVNSVKHQLSRTSGFVTVVTGVSIPSAEEPWDSQTPRCSRSTASSVSTSGASGSSSAAQAVQQVAQRAASTRYFAEAGEVREVQTQGQGSQSEPPGQTLTVFRGLAASDGRANQAARLAINRTNPRKRLPGVAYATPFAWGKCGLVLPRYPGTRVMMVHRNGQGNDPVEIGSLWESGHGPDSQAGDWWLILPVDIPESERATIAGDATPQEHTGKVSQDLIDAEGNRIIEVGELTIRVGKDSLKNAGERPDRPDDESSVTIEHTKEGSKIVMKPDGSVVITAKNIEFDAGDGNITMKAGTLDVKTTDKIQFDAGSGNVDITASAVDITADSTITAKSKIALDAGSGNVEITANTVDVSVQTSMNVS